jgi:Right handed beta helix region
VPSDIEVRRNHFRRPMAWKGVWKTKNLWECKSCQRVLIEANVMENNWVDAQNGFAILLQGLSDNNNSPWNRVADITIRDNIIRNVPSGINIASRLAYNGGSLPVNPGARITITNNVVTLNAALSGSGKAMQLLSDLQDVTVAGNTFVDQANANASSAMLMDMVTGTGPTARLRILNNVFGKANYPVIGNGTATALQTFAKYAPDGTLSGNAFAATTSTGFPTGNLFPTSLTSIMSGVLSSNYAVSAVMTLSGVTPGASWSAVSAATQGVVQE